MTRNPDEQQEEVTAPVIGSSLEHRRATVAHGSGPTRLPIVLALIGLTGLAYRVLPLWDPARPGIPDARMFFFDWSDTTPQLVYAAAGLLLFRRRRELSEALAGQGLPWLSAPFLGLAVLLFCWAKHAGAVDLELLSLLFLMPGAALLLFGPRFARLLVLPVVVLAFAIPPPGVLANQVLFFLRLSTRLYKYNDV